MSFLSGLFGRKYAAIGPAEARRRVVGGAVLLDVREPSEWRAGHAPKARHIPLNDLDRRRKEIPAGRDLLTPTVEVVQRDVPGLGCVPGAPLGGLADVEQHRAADDAAPGLGRADRGVLAAEQAGQETHRPFPSWSAADVRGRPAAAALV